MSTMTRRVTLAAAAAALTAILLAGCSAASGGSTSGGAPARDSSVTQSDVQSAATGESGDAVVVTAAMTVTADKPSEAADKAVDLAREAGGRVDGRDESSPEGGVSNATVTLRVPADKLEDVRRGIGELGHVEDQSMSTETVGGKQRDLAARIATLQASLKRFEGWLASAKTTADLVSLETEIATRQTELEGLLAEQRALDDQVAMSTLTTTFRSEYRAPALDRGPRNIGEAFVVGWNAFAGFWNGTSIVLAMVLPWLLLLGGIAWAVVVLVRRAARRRPVPVGPAPSGQPWPNAQAAMPAPAAANRPRPAPRPSPTPTPDGRTAANAAQHREEPNAPATPEPTGDRPRDEF